VARERRAATPGGHVWYVRRRRARIATVAGVLAYAPPWVWRVQGWRRSGRLMGELTAAIRDGRIDSRGAVILPADGRR
jgi:hypothetical protein